MRPTSDFPWPALGHWAAWLVQSANDPVNLKVDFPYVKWMGFTGFVDQALRLKSLGEPVKNDGVGCCVVLSTLRVVTAGGGVALPVMGWPWRPCVSGRQANVVRVTDCC